MFPHILLPLKSDFFLALSLSDLTWRVTSITDCLIWKEVWRCVRYGWQLADSMPWLMGEWTTWVTKVILMMYWENVCDLYDVALYGKKPVQIYRKLAVISALSVWSAPPCSGQLSLCNLMSLYVNSHSVTSAPLIFLRSQSNKHCTYHCKLQYSCYCLKDLSSQWWFIVYLQVRYLTL